jgi:outer membrane protein OmpA-like peptidoglycan-associated protein
MKIIITLLFVGIFSISLSQEITVKGSVKESITGKGVTAKIIYKSYPTGSLTETFNDSTFSFTIFGSSKYVITAEAVGYIKNTILILPAEAKNGMILRDIELTSNGKTIRLKHLIFDMGRAVIKPESFQELDQLVAFMKTNPKIEIQLEGHTDNQGNANKNLELSRERVEAVKKYLVKEGVGKSRIQTKAFGGTQPLSTENTEAARALNRRVEMRVLKE